MRFLVVVAVLAFQGVQPFSVHAHGNTPDDIDVLIHAAAEYRGAPYWQMQRILECESVHWNRRVIDGTWRGRSGEIGIAQILPGRGLGPLFESRGGDYSASDSIYFLAWAITHGLRHHWSC
jgi:hypothetical protein